MNTPDPHSDDALLRALLHDAVADVEPRDGLADVRRRTRRPARRRRWAPVLLGAGAVAATVVVATFVVTGLGGSDNPPDDQQVASSTGPTADDEPITAAAGIYFVSDTSNGPRLFREFQAVTPSSDPAVKVLVALRRLTADVGPVDPDYETLWPADSFESVRVEDGRVVVVLGTDRALAPTPVEAEGRYGVQQAVYTAEAAISQTLPVSFEYDGQVARWVLGTRVGAVVDRDRSYDLTAPVNITDPAENLAVDTGVLLANGTQADNVRRVDWSLAQDGVVVRSGRAVPTDITGPDARATLGAPGWETGPIDLSGLPPGSYVFRVTTTVEGQTSDRPSEFSDTRTIAVR